MIKSNKESVSMSHSSSLYYLSGYCQYCSFWMSYNRDAGNVHGSSQEMLLSLSYKCCSFCLCNSVHIIIVVCSSDLCIWSQSWYSKGMRMATNAFADSSIAPIPRFFGSARALYRQLEGASINGVSQMLVSAQPGQGGWSWYGGAGGVIMRPCRGFFMSKAINSLRKCGHQLLVVKDYPQEGV